MSNREPTVTATVEVVKPATAEDWLGKNQSNRAVRDRVVAAYARDMAAGNWRITGEGIKFATSGRLLDGQHRLHAVVRADVAVPMLVVRGVPEDAQEVMDSGAGRTAGDALRLRGEANYSTLAAAARLAIAYEAGRIASNSGEKTTHAEIIEFVSANEDLRYAVEVAASWRNAIDVPISVLVVAIWRLYRLNPEDCLSFFSQLANKTGLRSGDPVLALLNRLTEVRRSSRRLDRADYLSLIFRAWNLWRTRKSVQRLPVAVRGDSVDIPEPR